MDFCRSYTMVCYDNLRMWRLMGVEIDPITTNKKTNVTNNKVTNKTFFFI